MTRDHQWRTTSPLEAVHAAPVAQAYCCSQSLLLQSEACCCCQKLVAAVQHAGSTGSTGSTGSADSTGTTGSTDSMYTQLCWMVHLK